MLRKMLLCSICLVVSIPCLSATLLEELPRTKSYTSARFSSYQPNGGNADGRQDTPLLPGQKRVLADVTGPGKIAHIWMTLDPMDEDVLRNLILRMYWDGEKTPSVEVPIGEFFGLGHGLTYTFESLPFAIGNDRGINCFFQMPFRKSALVVAENLSKSKIGAFYYYVDYQKFRKPQPDLLYLHAQYRQQKPCVSGGNYTMMEAKGKGHYVGCFLYVRSNDGGWWGEGDDMIYIDGAKKPQLNGTGTEDYFCHAWGMKEGQAGLRFGAPLFEVFRTGVGNKNTMYRFHIEDAVAFDKDIRVTIEHGHANDRWDDFSSVAYWYQTEPHAAFPKLPPPGERIASQDRIKALLDAKDYAAYRAAQTQILENAGSTEIRLRALYAIAESYLNEGDKEKAKAKLLAMVQPIPDNNWGAKAMAKLKEVGATEAELPKSNVSLVPGIHDGRLIKTTTDGQQVFRTDHKNGSGFMYFDVPNDFSTAPDKPVLVEVEYYDMGLPSDTFRIDYNSDFEGTEVERNYHPSLTFPKPGKKGWRYAILLLEKPRFAGKQHGHADLRISSQDDGDEYVKAVILRSAGE